MTSPTTLPARLRFTVGSPVPGLAVAERRVPDPSATLICVHGALDRGRSFARLARRLNDVDFVTYDRRGYQGSRAVAPVDLAHHIDDLVELVVREGRTRPVILVGHSYGGLVTFGASLREPSRVALIVNYESPYPWLVRRERSSSNDGATPSAEQFFRRVVSDSAWERLGEAERESRRLDEPALANDLATIHHGPVPYDLSTLRVPCTYVHGDGALAHYYRQLAAALHALNPLIQPNELRHANHAAHLKNPDQLVDIIHQRWRDVCASA